MIFPVFWRFKNAQQDIREVPPYFSVTSTANRTRTSGLAPLWTTIRSMDSPALNFQLLGGLLGFERDAAGEWEFTVLYVIKM